MSEMSDLLTTRRGELDARRKGLIQRLAVTAEHLRELLAGASTPAAEADAYQRVAGDLEAIYVEQCWEALDGRPRQLESAAVARRKMREAGRGDGGHILTGILEHARRTASAAAMVRRAIAKGYAHQVGMIDHRRLLLTTTAAAFGSIWAEAALAVEDADAATAAEQFGGWASALADELEQSSGTPANDIVARLVGPDHLDVDPEPQT